MNQSSVTPAPQGGSSTMKWLLIILVIIIVLGGGYWLYVKYGKTSATTTTASPSPTTSAKTSPSSIITASPSASVSAPPTISTTAGLMENQKIDAWIAANNLNQYGDSKDTVYAGGNPLFNEATGQTTDRYEYIKQQHPDKPWNK